MKNLNNKIYSQKEAEHLDFILNGLNDFKNGADNVYEKLSLMEICDTDKAYSYLSFLQKEGYIKLNRMGKRIISDGKAWITEKGKRFINNTGFQEQWEETEKFSELSQKQKEYFELKINQLKNELSESVQDEIKKLKNAQYVFHKSSTNRNRQQMIFFWVMVVLTIGNLGLTIYNILK
jgi:predicted transcriptional regulator